MNPARFDQFAEAYVQAVLDVATEQRYKTLPGEQVADYALRTSLAMLDLLAKYGVAVIEHYHINQAGAIARACASLNIPSARASIDNFLEI